MFQKYVFNQQTDILNKYMIPSVRHEVRWYYKKYCLPIISGNGYTAFDLSSLPKDRLSFEPPFTVTGVDLRGALHIKDDNGQIHKAYICIN